MKIKNLPVIFFFLSLSMSFYGQKKDSLQTGYDLNFNNSSTVFSTSQVLENFDYQAQYSKLFLYNNTTNLYNVYSNTDDSYVQNSFTNVYRPKSNFFTNLFLGNDRFPENNTLLLNKSLLIDEDVSYRVRDSFNPHGASNFSEAILGGVLGLIFN